MDEGGVLERATPQEFFNRGRHMKPLPVIDVSALVSKAPGSAQVAARIGEACRAHGMARSISCC